MLFVNKVVLEVASLLAAVALGKDIRVMAHHESLMGKQSANSSKQFFVLAKRY